MRILISLATINNDVKQTCCPTLVSVSAKACSLPLKKVAIGVGWWRIDVSRNILQYSMLLDVGQLHCCEVQIRLFPLKNLFYHRGYYSIPGCFGFVQFWFVCFFVSCKFVFLGLLETALSLLLSSQRTEGSTITWFTIEAIATARDYSCAYIAANNSYWLMIKDAKWVQSNILALFDRWMGKHLEVCPPPFHDHVRYTAHGFVTLQKLVVFAHGNITGYFHVTPPPPHRGWYT